MIQAVVLELSRLSLLSTLIHQIHLNEVVELVILVECIRRVRGFATHLAWTLRVGSARRSPRAAALFRRSINHEEPTPAVSLILCRDVAVLPLPGPGPHHILDRHGRIEA